MKKIFTTLISAFGLIASMHAQTALNFDGNNDHVVIGNTLTTDLEGVNTFTVEAWVNSASATGLGVIVGNYNFPTNNNEMQFQLRRDNNQYTFWLDDGDGYQVVVAGAGSVQVGEWQHVAGTWDGSEIKIYVDGVELGVNSNLDGPGLIATSNEVVIGGNSINEYFTGSIDNIRIWNTTRTATQIANFMDCEVIASEAGLVANYHFNDGEEAASNSNNTVLFDNSGNGYHGTLTNFALSGTNSNFVASDRTNYMSIQSAIGSSAANDRMSGRTVGDFNGDGFDDIVVITQGGAHSIYYGNGLGHFETATAIPNTIGSNFASGDIDNDGDIDIVNYGGTEFKVYLNDGTGSFTEMAVQELDGTGGIAVIEIADLNGDNLPDLVMGNGATTATAMNEIWFNTGTVGNPSFTFSQGLNSTYAQVNGIAVGDIDGDGDLDLAFGGYSWGGMVFINDNNTFVQGQSLGGYNGYLRFIDWNQNGLLDLVNSDGYNNWGVRVRYNDGTGTFDTNAEVIISLPNSIDYFLAAVQYADMNGDGFLDIVSRNWGGNGMIFLSNGCIVTQQTACELKLGPADNTVHVGDFNGDGKPDVFCGARDRKSSASLNFLDAVTTPPLSNILSTTGDDVCEGDQAALEANLSAPGDVSWYTDASGGSLVGTGNPFNSSSFSPGTYTFYAESENPNSCISLREPVTFEVNENPEVALNSSSIIELDCFGDTDGEITIDITLNGSATSATYFWDNDGSGNTSTNQNLLNLTAGEYNLVLTDNNDCTAELAVEITQPDEIILSSNATDLLCNGDEDGEIELTVTGGTGAYSFEWDDAASSTTQDLENLGAGTYTVEVTDENDCEASIATTVTEPDALDAATSVEDALCNGEENGEIELTVTGGTGAYSFEWDDAASSTTQDLENLGAGTYSVEITDENGCELTVSATVAEPDAISASATTTQETMGSDGAIDLTVSGGSGNYTYEWTGPNNFTSTDQNPEDLAGGMYEVTITDENGCTFTLEVEVPSVVGLSENTLDMFKLFPNPSTGKFTISSSAAGTIAIINANGQVIHTTTTHIGETEHQLTHLARGVYSVRLTTEYGVQLKKLVIQ